MTVVIDAAASSLESTVRNERLQSAAFIRQFVEEKLDGDLCKWLDFDFFSLDGSGKYGCPDRQFDCDDTNLIRAVYVLLWGEDFPQLVADNIGTGKLYRGDTLNTFHTMFGRELPDRPGFFAGLEKYEPDDALREKVRKFRKRSARLGNFTVLPNISHDGDTLNTWRGCSCLRDFFDRFLAQIQCAVSGKSCLEEIKTLVEKNIFFFKHFSGPDGFQRWAELAHFQDYLDNNHDSSEVYLPVAQIFQMNYHWFRPDQREDYFNAAHIYLDRADEIISNRTKSLLGHITLALDSLE